ncbi:MAG TPA: BamA/TamA family outer membrane protein, partial [Lacibacter sp.]|nr:BamA/TamA family outer membrane protein [Lacibacter sp.]
TRKQGIIVLPLLYYTPDTRWAYGGAGAYYFRVPSRDSNQADARTSYVQFLADYTENKQLDIWSTWNIFTRNENYLLKGDARFRNFPDRFYGIGNSTTKEEMERYSYNLLQLKAMFLKKIRPGLFLGLDYQYEFQYDFSYTAGGLLESGNITGSRGGTGTGFGIVGIRDNRDNIINAYKGSLLELSSYFFVPAMGSNFRYTNLNAQYQKYWQLRHKHILALQTRMRLTYGDVPFLALSTLGGDDLLRGYARNRFRDNHFAGTQIEYRFPLFWRLGMVGFAGVGDVFGSSSQVRLNTLKYSVGSGLRLVVDPAERLNIRFDYGYGREGGQWYFMVAESF